MVAALAVVAALLVIAPPIQTWAARQVLGERPGLHGTLGSLSAGFGRVDVADLRLEKDGAVLTAPSLQATMPLARSLLGGKYIVRKLVARGWTFDLTHVSAPKGTSAKPVRAAQAAAAILGSWRLPLAFSADGVDADGDILLAAADGAPPERIHVTLTGGGLSSDSGGQIAFDAECDNPGLSADSVTASGHVSAQLRANREIAKLEVDADLTAKGGTLPADLSVTARVSATRADSGEEYGLDLSRAGQPLLSLDARLSASGAVDGRWKMDLHDTDVAPFAIGRPLPSFAAKGEGRYEADSSLGRARVVGSLGGVASRLKVLDPELERLGTVDVDSTFDLAIEGRVARVAALGVSLICRGSGPPAAPRLELHALQPFEVDVTNGSMKAEAARDLATASVRFPLAWIPPLPGRFTLDGTAAGSFLLRSSAGTLSLRQQAPLTARGTTLSRAGSEVARGLDLSVSLEGGLTATGWEVKCSPLRVQARGAELASADFEAVRAPGPDQPVAVTGSWKADPAAIAARTAPGAVRIMGKAASGTFTAALGPTTTLDATAEVGGRGTGRSASATVHAEVDPDGDLTFSGPVKVVLPSGSAEVQAEGSLSREDSVSRLELKLNSDEIGLEHLRFLAAPFAPPSGGGDRPPGSGRDASPFWGSLVGTVKFGFGKLEMPGQSLEYVGGLVGIESGAIQLVGGHAGLPHKNLLRVEGSVAFDPAAPLPYRFKATASVNDVDEASLFPEKKDEGSRPLEGRFTASCSLGGAGGNLQELEAATRGEYHFSSASGVIRMLKTTVADAVPEASAPVADAVGSVGSAVGALFGVKGGGLESAKNPVSKSADAAITFTYAAAEIGYDRLEATAVEDPDSSFRLTHIEMDSPELRFSGTGSVAAGAGPFLQRALGMDLAIGVKGDNQKLLAVAGLLSPGKDDQGFTMLVGQPVHFGGTLESVDVTQWRSLLVQATRKGAGATPAPAH